MVDIRLETQIVVEKNGKYLIGLHGIPRWSDSPYDAWQTRNTVNAVYVAWKVNGDLALFNPIVAESRKLDWMQREDVVRHCVVAALRARARKESGANAKSS